MNQWVRELVEAWFTGETNLIIFNYVNKRTKAYFAENLKKQNRVNVSVNEFLQKKIFKKDTK